MLLTRPQVQQPQAATSDVQAILKAADAAQDKLTSLRYTMTASFENLPSSNQPTSIEMRGEIVRPDRYTMSSDRIGDYIVIAKDTYFRHPGSEDWLKVDQTPLGATLVDPNTLGDFASYYKDATLLADEQVADVDCKRIRLNLAADELSGSGGSPFGAQAVEAEFWVGKADSLPRKLVLNLSLGQNEPIRTRVETTFSDFGADIEIEAPATANP